MQSGALALATLLAAGLFTTSAWHLYQRMRVGGAAGPFDQPVRRWRGVLVHVLGQGRLLTEPYSGLMHALIFWGFLVVTVMTVTNFLTGLFPGLELPWVERNPLILVSVETFQALVLAAIGYAFWRRLVLRPRRLSFTADGLLILTLIGTLMVTAFVAVGARIALAPRESDAWSYLSSWLAPWLSALPTAELVGMERAAWWGHVLTVLAFLVYLPHSKHLHIVTAGPNVWLRNLRPRGELPLVDVEDRVDKGQPLGAGDVAGLTWKDWLDSYSCTECGRCQEECPASRTGKPLSPKYLILDLKHHLLHARADEAMVGGAIRDEVLWDCTTCRACVDACPVFIDHVPKIVEMRRHLVMDLGRFEPDVRRLFDNLEATGNPWRFPRANRGDWAADLGVPILGRDVAAGGVEYVLWAGCAGAYDERYRAVMRALVALLRRAGVTFAALGSRETCTGDPARRAGHEYLYQTLARQNVAALGELGVGRMVASCPHCFNSLKSEYPQLGGQYQVIHHTELLAQLVADGRLTAGSGGGPHPDPLPEGEGIIVTYHDPCYIGRYHDLYEQPRDVLRSLPRVTLREMPGGCHHGRAMCCGAGGARAFMEERRGTRINHLRLVQAMAAEPGTIATACPYCIMMLEDAARTKGLAEQVRVRDVGELLRESLA